MLIGKGLHSQSGIAKIKPAIEELIQKWANEIGHSSYANNTFYSDTNLSLSWIPIIQG